MKNKENLKYLLKSFILSLIITFIFLVLISLLLRYTSLQERKLTIINNIIMVISIALSSAYLAIKIKENGWLYGSILGVLYCLFILILNIIFLKASIFKTIYIIKLIIAMIIGAIGGIIGINLI